jgi:hypothetical protein
MVSFCDGPCAQKKLASGRVLTISFKAAPNPIAVKVWSACLSCSLEQRAIFCMPETDEETTSELQNRKSINLIKDDKCAIRRRRQLVFLSVYAFIVSKF